MTAYFSRSTPIHCLDPRLKIAWAIVVSVLAVVLRHPLWLGMLFCLTVVPWYIVRPPIARLRLLLILAATTVLGTMISQGFFYGFQPRTEWVTLLPGLSLCRQGVVYGAVVSLRLLAVMSAGTIVVVTTYPADLVLALSTLRVPHSFAFMLTLAMRFLPETIEQGRRILVAQQLRGAGGKGVRAAFRRFGLLLPPLIAVSLRSARQVALAAEVRAYSADRVPFRSLRFGRVDWVVAAGLMLLTIAGAAIAVLDQWSLGGWPQ